MTQKVQQLWVMSVFWLIFGAGCSRQADQMLDELNAADFLVRLMVYYDHKFPESPFTNVQEVFVKTSTPYPKRWHYRFKRFGKHAGFENSVYEKYVVVPPGTRSALLPGELVLVNARPFPNRRGKHGRLVFSRTSSKYDDWNIKWLPEDHVQQIFQVAGQSIPKPPVLPVPTDLPEYEPPPLLTRIHDFVGDVTANVGLGTGTGRYLMYALVLVCAVGISLLIFLAFRNRQ